jgi:hypothetical protein
MKRIRKIDLRHKKMTDAKKAMRRLLAWRKEKEASVRFHFLLPTSKPLRKGFFYPEKISSRCPYCNSPLIETEAGTVCSGKNLQDIGRDIQRTINRWGDKAELFLNRRANRFFDYYIVMGRDMTCDYIVGNDERKWRVNNRILRPGVDRKMIKKK